MFKCWTIQIIQFSLIWRIQTDSLISNLESAYKQQLCEQDSGYVLKSFMH